MSWIKKLLAWLFLLVVTLSWDPSPSDITGYNIYAGPLGGPFKKVADVGNVLTATLDLEKRQCFAVTAYDDKGNESIYSNIVCEKINFWVEEQ